MNELLIWNPVRELDHLHGRLDELFTLSPFTARPAEGGNVSASWEPAVDIVEDEHGYLVKVEAPGLAPENVNVKVESGTLSIAGERPRETYGKDVTLHRAERNSGRFERNFLLPDDADVQKVSATFKDGLLHVHAAKLESAKPRSIEVKVS